MKVKLSVTDFEKFKLSCEAVDIRITEHKNYGAKKVIAIVDYKHASQLYELGLIQDTIIKPELITGTGPENGTIGKKKV